MYGYGNNRQWGWGSAMGERGGFMPQHGPMMGGGAFGSPQSAEKPGSVPGIGKPVPPPGMVDSGQPGIMPMGWRLDQLRQRMDMLPSNQWQDRDGMWPGRLGRFWQWQP